MITNHLELLPATVPTSGDRARAAKSPEQQKLLELAQLRSNVFRILTADNPAYSKKK
jgi:hypothetical protein